MKCAIFMKLVNSFEKCQVLAEPNPGRMTGGWHALGQPGVHGKTPSPPDIRKEKRKLSSHGH